MTNNDVNYVWLKDNAEQAKNYNLPYVFAIYNLVAYHLRHNTLREFARYCLDFTGNSIQVESKIHEKL